MKLHRCRVSNLNEALHAEATASADLLRPLPPDQTAAPCPLNTPINFNPCARNGRSRKGPLQSDKMPSA
jgi:hypothetical protein